MVRTTDIVAAIADALGIDGDGRLEGPAWVAWRLGGKVIGGGWSDAERLKDALSGTCPRKGKPPDAIEICLTGNFRPVAPEAFRSVFSNSARGRKGLEIRLGEAVHRISPTTTIATNRSFAREIERLSEKLRLSPDELLRSAGIRSFSGRSMVVRLSPTPRVTPIFRSSELVEPGDVGPALCRDVIGGLSSWLVRNVAPSGRMTYKYWPSRGEKSKADNTIRQFMATVALGRIASRRRDRQAIDAARRNLAYNLKTYYEEIDGLGTITLDGKAKLGATALAALAILEFRQAGHITAGDYAGELSGLSRCVEHLWQRDGSFRTFLRPGGRNDNQNFYPGEALLFWAALYRTTRDPALLRRCLASFSYYSSWHRAHRNPAFVPWHSQAYVSLFETARISALHPFVFEMNDWLLKMQQWGDPLAADLWGRFYNPDRPDFGPPHASSTGVYMEGLADAWRLARMLREDSRAEAYAQSLRRGLRSVAQLQFREPDVDGFYVSQRSAVTGGMRTETYNNEIRVDNVQHCLMALLKLEAEPDFPWA